MPLTRALASRWPDDVSSSLKHFTRHANKPPASVASCGCGSSFTHNATDNTSTQPTRDRQTVFQALVMKCAHAVLRKWSCIFYTRRAQIHFPVERHRLVLPDGSRPYTHAATNLRYPNKLCGVSIRSLTTERNTSDRASGSQPTVFFPLGFTHAASVRAFCDRDAETVTMSPSHGA